MLPFCEPQAPAKGLLRAAEGGDREALERFATLPRRIAIADLALHDAPSVTVREHAFLSWGVLRYRVDWNGIPGGVPPPDGLAELRAA